MNTLRAIAALLSKCAEVTLVELGQVIWRT